MRTSRILFVLIAAILANSGAANAQDRNGYWYYCVSARSYYPYAQNCAEGWQRVASWQHANQTQVRPQQQPQQPVPLAEPKASSPSAEQSGVGADNSAFAAGTQDRKAWETWFASLSGDVKTGAEWWADHRSDKPQPNCTALTGDQQKGCAEARLRLSISDKLRRQSMDYRRGWNDYVVAPAVVPQPATAVATPAPTVPTEQGTACEFGIGCDQQVTPAPAAMPVLKVVPDNVEHAAVPSPMRAADDSFQPAVASEDQVDSLDKDKLIELVAVARDKMENAANDLQKDSLGNLFKKITYGKQFRGWSGVIYDMGADGNGDAWVTISLGNNIWLETSKIAWGDEDGTTLINKNSPLFQKLFSMREGQTVTVSGTLLREKSMTSEGTIREPEFITRFTDIEPQ